jgi:hypothetical protein
VNVNPPQNNVVIQTNTATNPFTISENSVVLLEWTVFYVPTDHGGPGFTRGTHRILCPYTFHALRIMTETFVPPKPKAFTIAVGTACSRAALGT